MIPWQWDVHKIIETVARFFSISRLSSGRPAPGRASRNAEKKSTK